MQIRLRSLNMRCTGNKAQLKTRLLRAEKERKARSMPEIQEANNVQIEGFAEEKKITNFVETREAEEQNQTIDHEDLEHVTDTEQTAGQHAANVPHQQDIYHERNFRRERRYRYERSLYNREFELIRRENEMMKRELELAKQQIESLRMTTSQEPSASPSQNSSAVQFTLTDIKNLLPTFDGKKTAYNTWEKQLKLIKQIYELDEKSTKILLASKLVGSIAEWFHSSSEHLSLPVSQLLNRMRVLFNQDNKRINLRKEFEERKWKPNETFTEYFYQKIIMANKIPVEESEIVDYLIEGIPDSVIKHQAMMQCFENKEIMFKAMKDVTCWADCTRKLKNNE